MDALQLLPEVDRADELKRRSMALVGAAVPADLFIWRDEPQNDKGVDLSIEAVVSGRATRFLAVVQVKATDSPTLNTDQSFSLPVATRNLNYLLNGTCPLYVLWIAPRNELRYAWARDEAKRLYQSNPDWGEQDTVVLRMSRVLDESGWREVHERVQREGRSRRKQHDYLVRAGLSDAAAFGVDPETLDVLTPDEAFDAVRSHGIAIVSAGYPLAVKRVARLLNSVQLADPAVPLAVAFACYQLGEHFEARGHLARVMPHRARLSAFDRHLLDSLLNECNLRFGVVDDAGYREKQLQIEQEAPPFFAAQVRVDRVRWEHLSEFDTRRRRERLEELRSVASQIEAERGSSEFLKLHAALIRLYGEVADSNLGVVEAAITLRARAAMRLNPAAGGSIAAWQAATAVADRVHADSQELLKRAVDLKNPLLIGEALLTQCVYRIGCLGQSAMLHRAMTGKRVEVPAGAVESICTQLRQAVSLFERAGAVESVVRTTLVLAQWHSTNQDYEEAKELVDGVMGLALGMGYTHYVEQGEAILSRTTELDRHEQALANPPDSDTIAACQSDEEVADFALFNLQAAELPEERLPVVHRVCLVMREESKTRLEWCRHFRLLVGEEHAEVRPASYATDPEWFGWCMLFKFHTYTPSTDANSVTDRFKNTYCSTCSDRCPKSRG